MSLIRRLFGSPLHTLKPIRSRDPLRNWLYNFTDEDILQPILHSPFTNYNSPLVDVKEENDRFELLADIPGFKKDNIQCIVDEGMSYDLFYRLTTVVFL